MAHLLPPAGITYPESEIFRNYLVRPPAHKQEKQNQVVVCCERTQPGGPGCRSEVRCKVLDGDKVYAAKLCPDSADVITNFCLENDCRPRAPLTQPGMLCYSGCQDSCPQPCPKPGLQTYKTYTFRQPCAPCAPPPAPYPKCCTKPKPQPCFAPCSTPPPPCPRPCRPQNRAQSAGCRPRPRLVREVINSHCYTYQY